MNIEGSVALVTGANRGLGKVLAEQLRARGAKKVYAGARDPSKIAYPGVEPVKLDITNAADVEAAAKALGDVNLVINNAGIAQFASFADDPSLEIARKAMETNYFGTLRIANAFAPIPRQERRWRPRQHALGLKLDHLSVACCLFCVEIGCLGADQWLTP